MKRKAFSLGTALLTLGAAACAPEPPEPVVVSVTATATRTHTTTPTPTPTPTPTIEESEPSKLPSATATTASSVAEPTVVNCLEGTPGPALWSDGAIRYSEDCWPNNGGPAYAEAERNAGLPLERDAPSRTDGCIGPAAVCGYYDEFGNPIWFDKKTGDTSPRYYDENGNPTMDPQ